jgi:hypothetical protein
MQGKRRTIFLRVVAIVCAILIGGSAIISSFFA